MTKLIILKEKRLITKNENTLKKIIIVTDEQGNRYESTYQKRAKGLVKSGRARYLDEHTICLACPPNINNLEEINMNNNEKLEPAMNMDYIIAKINEIIEMNKKALADPNLASLELMDGVVHPINAICETNNHLIELFKIFSKSLVEEASPKDTMFKSLNDALKTAVQMQNLPIVEMIIKELKELTR